MLSPPLFGNYNSILILVFSPGSVLVHLVRDTFRLQDCLNSLSLGFSKEWIVSAATRRSALTF